MRFFPDGPHIPNRLLADHERGNVVFLCGAGVSVAAGLPNFEDLAKKLVDRLGAPVNATSRVLIERARQAKALGIPAPTDVVISQLQREYTPDQLIEAVAAELRCPEDYDYSFHRTITRLSRNPEGLPRLVTTNFENLFELADPKLRPVLPPSLPDLGLRQPLDGLVYLHGKLGERQGRPVALSDLILGSGDFGRAYLAHGWATRFLRQLLSSYSVVLVGYSASDPPVQYLLEGLVTDPATSSTKIYAFIPSGSPEDVQLWANRGVHPIIYAWDKPHLKLWETLSAWADLADDPVRWRAKIIAKERRRRTLLSVVKRCTWSAPLKEQRHGQKQNPHQPQIGFALSIERFATQSLERNGMRIRSLIPYRCSASMTTLHGQPLRNSGVQCSVWIAWPQTRRMSSRMSTGTCRTPARIRCRSACSISRGG
jgi:hypothetical protein